MELRSMADWFRLCRDNEELTGLYEKYVLSFFRNFVTQKPPFAEKQLMSFLRNPLDTGFYRHGPDWFRKTLLPLLFSVIHIFTLVWSGLMFLSLPVTAFIKDKDGVSWMRHVVSWLFASKAGGRAEWLWYLLTTVIIGSVVGAVIYGLIVLYRFLKMRYMMSRLRKIEAQLEEPFRLIPPKFRNKDALKAFYEAYCEMPDITFGEAVDLCDNYLRLNGLPQYIKAILFDLPYENHMSAPHEPQKYDSVGENKEPDVSPFLPADIASHTYMGSEDAEADLNRLVGLKDVKEQIRRLKNRIAFYGTAGSGGCGHMAFLGSAGTGKTQMARIVTKILYDFGYIQQNKIVEVDGDYLKAEFIGQTGKRTSAIVEHAMGGVLFIDEAYLLYEKGNGFGNEAVGVLLKAMEDRRDKLVVILAGYEDQMTRLIAANEGFSSRIKHKIYFRDYTVDELYDIFLLFLSDYRGDKAYVVEDSAKALLKETFSLEKKSPYFGNARSARNAVDQIMDYHADRCIAQNDMQNRYVITLEDVRAYADQRESDLQSDTRNYAGANQIDETIVRVSDLKMHTKPGVKEPQKVLDRMVGLEHVKEELKAIGDARAFYGSEGCGNVVGHMIFRGPPGTGKSSMAAVVTGYLYKLGLIKENRYLSIIGDFLRGSYVGHTGKRALAVVQYAIGGVLFIDEAALLCSDDAFGAEALSVIGEAMAAYLEDLVVIFAGTDEQMSVFCQRNAGIAAMISHDIWFDAYSSKELCQIFRMVASKNRFAVEHAVWPEMQRYFRQRMADPQFGNAMEVMRLFEAVRKAHIKAYAGNEDTKYVIELRDFVNATANDTERKDRQ